MAIQNYADNGAFAPRKIVEALRTTSDELARSLGLGKDAIQRKDRIASTRTQRRLRQMVEVLNKVEPRFGIKPAQLADPAWRDWMLSGKAVSTQDLAEAAIRQGYTGIVVPSYARGAPADALNLVLWDRGGRITLVDDDDRLGVRNQ